MPNFISSTANRFYVAQEAVYGQAAAIGSANRIAGLRLQLQQTQAKSVRLPKTGTRTFQGSSKYLKKSAGYQFETYLSPWSGSGAPSYGPLFEAALGGGDPTISGGQVVGSIASVSRMSTASPHGLTVGSAVTLHGELRFVSSVVDPLTFAVNAPFTQPIAAGDQFGPCATYRLGEGLPSVSLYDFWSPAGAISRVMVGAAVDEMEIDLNGDFHTIRFAGPAATVLDSYSALDSGFGLATFPAEPTLGAFSAAGVPGHLGQAWVAGGDPDSMIVTGASVKVQNNLEVRSREFGWSTPKAIVPGPRTVSASITLLAQNIDAMNQLYAQAKSLGTVTIMLQLGIEAGQLMGIYLPNVVPSIPHFDDSGERLLWTLSNNVAQGSVNDEIVIAFA